ncbi:Sporulation integral membrane protein YtvI [Candidatus Syntrophocurvum alkaliphilum]|uniref:Sporulation integral membrane protein YtvI n=1 Tax=Candidatus Syntrophocurvum alkaliphilum TaxID=2293317 RepID=A0A6I6DEW3_9FIRM|nr:sporulation integral membrane protein YtvI [Candidatus Syntrophocurvum alkaliphilum]QGT99202.1 Sporulation integral membrane protein YtvI [Candidatus Syntrophocurvum alkaliphilum]
MDPELQKSIKILTKLAIIVLALYAIFLLFTYVFPIVGDILTFIPNLILPFVLAIILAVLIEPVVHFFENKTKMRRSLSVFLSLTLVVGGLVYIISLVISVVTRELMALYKLGLSYSDELTYNILAAISDFRLFYLRLDLPPQVHTAIEDNIENAIEIIQTVAESIINNLVNLLTMLPNIFVFIMIATVATFFIMKDRAIIRKFILQIIPSNVRSKTRNIVGDLFRALVGFFKAYTILISVTTIITVIALKLLGVDYVLTIGILIGLLDILPILGPALIFIPWIIWQFVVGNTFMGLSLLILYITISIVRQFLEPKIVGDNIGLHPLVTLISLYIGLRIAGVIGIILGPVTVVIFIACYRAGLFDGLILRRT